MVTLFNVVSSDGFIARKNGDEDFIPDDLWAFTLQLFRKYDSLVMGRKTYEVMQNYNSDLLVPFEKLNIKKFILTSNRHLKVKDGYELIHSTEDVLKTGTDILVSSGLTTNDRLFDEKAVDTVILYKISVPIGEGIVPFSEKYKQLLVTESQDHIGPITEFIYHVQYS